ncbi:hypothetical protein B0H67DRAFT_385407 [Lasiosphaeris hirsuta]|uniref:Zn(2)-C6 fungal-type domain-containing protein n=1 Tax=Lasiosphaeris hirsuta TaxID=260670 RepID=A0AA39ZXP3_9PEZI|nr:hypothetical protein B0H67DRAFT_385407 [Lasiosphaeris hirsuta]
MPNNDRSWSPASPSFTTADANANADSEAALEPDGDGRTASSLAEFGRPRKARRASQKEHGLGVCDGCRKRRVKCDYQPRCRPCVEREIVCKRDHVPGKRGPKRGRGRVIDELKAEVPREAARPARCSSDEREMGASDGAQSATTPSASSFVSDRRHAPDLSSPSAPEQYRPTTRSYRDLIPQCVKLYYEHIYPIMPMLYMPDIWQMLKRAELRPSEQNLLYALSALTCFHMSGKSIQVEGPDSWERAGRYFLDEAESSRSNYDRIKEVSLYVIISSFWMSTSSFEIKDDEKSSYYMTEALHFARQMRLQDDASYEGLSPQETLSRQRVFWQLFVTERSLAMFRKQDIILRKTPKIPGEGHPYESPAIHAGFLQLISAYAPLDESFVTAWNYGSDPRVTIHTYLNLQNTLARPPAFIPHPDSAGYPSAVRQYSPTSIQKADLLITQQWLSLIVWRNSQKQQLVHQNSRYKCMQTAFPLAIAHRTARVLQSLPPEAVEVHGMGIFEKIYEIASSFVEVLNHQGGGPSPTTFGMDFANIGTGSDLGVLGVGRRGFTADPLEFFVKTLTSTPNSKIQFADRLLKLAHEKPGAMKMALSPILLPVSPWGTEGSQAWPGSTAGSVLGEVTDESDLGNAAQSGATTNGFEAPNPNFWSIDGSNFASGNTSAVGIIGQSLMDSNILSGPSIPDQFIFPPGFAMTSNWVGAGSGVGVGNTALSGEFPSTDQELVFSPSFTMPMAMTLPRWPGSEFPANGGIFTTTNLNHSGNTNPEYRTYPRSGSNGAGVSQRREVYFSG